MGISLPNDPHPSNQLGEIFVHQEEEENPYVDAIANLSSSSSSSEEEIIDANHFADIFSNLNIPPLGGVC